MIRTIIEEAAQQSITIDMKKEQNAVLTRERRTDDDLLSIQVSYLGAYGMGEKYDQLNQRNKKTVNQVIEKFCFQGDKTYCSAPFFVTDTGLGIYVDTKEKTTFSFDEKIMCSIPKRASVYVFTGTVPEIIADYMNFFGKAKLPPKYAFGIWISANHWNSEASVEEQLAALERYEYPASVMVLEAWSDEATFYIFQGAKYRPLPEGSAFTYQDFDFADSVYWNNPKEMIHKLHQKGIRLVLWQIPVYKNQDAQETVSLQLEQDRQGAVEKGLCVFTEDGEPYTIPEGNWFAGSMIPDFTKEETRSSWFSKRQYLLDIGVDGFKTDGGEFIYRENLCFANGMNGAQAKNQYAQEYTKAYTTFIGADRVLFSRAGYAGAHTTPIHWAGDQQSVNEELCSVLRAGLSAAMTGIIFWGFDIAGFAGPLPTLDLYRRATQLGCFSPVMQWHSEPDGGQFKELLPSGEGNHERSPWNLAKAYQSPAFIGEMRFWHCLRMNLLPYLYSTALYCVENDRPMMRPLVYDWAEDKRTTDIEDEYMLGESLLVAPLMEENQRSRKLYLPQGSWYGLFSHQKYEGGTFHTSAEEEKCPVYIRAGHALVLRGAAKEGLGQPSDNKTEAIHTLHVVMAGEKGSFCFRDEMEQWKISWDQEGVDIDASEHYQITWEVVK